MLILNKTVDSISPYTYLLKFNINGMIYYYYGVRYSNVRLKLRPSDDLFKKYFTSSKIIKTLLTRGILPYEIIIHKVFQSHIEACEFEVSFLTKIDAKLRKDFINQTNLFNNSLPYSNAGRFLTDETKLKISISSKSKQSSQEYREYRKNQMKNKWSDPDFIEYMKNRNASFFSSDKGKFFIKNHLNTIWEGRKHSNITKQKMSESAKKTCKNIDCSKRAFSRKRHSCPICFKSNLDGSNFNRHMMAIHNWKNEDCTNYKKNSTQ